MVERNILKTALNIKYLYVYLLLGLGVWFDLFPLFLLFLYDLVSLYVSVGDGMIVVVVVEIVSLIIGTRQHMAVYHQKQGVPCF